MPIDFDENKPGVPRFSPNGRYLGKTLPVKEKKEYGPIIALILKVKLAKDEDHAKFILFIIVLIAFGLAIHYGILTYKTFHPDVNTAPIELDQATE
jgi:hypothetical protein